MGGKAERKFLFIGLSMRKNSESVSLPLGEGVTVTVTEEGQLRIYCAIVALIMMPHPSLNKVERSPFPEGEGSLTHR